MKSNLACILCCAALAVAVMGGLAVAQTTEPSERPRHLPMRPHLNEDGSFKRGLRGQVTTENWSGFAVTAGAPYTSASATWQVPNASYDGGNTPYGYEYVFNWVGVGGYGDATLIQLGTESVVSTSGVRSFYVWYELYPDVALPISRTVKPGDIITASLECTAACSPSSVQTWLLTISDETAGWTWMQTFQYQSSMASAEWITEPPYSGGILPLADYGQATYDPVAANGQNPNLSLSANGIIAQDPWGQTSNPSAPANGDIFSTCWGKGSLTPCTAGSFTTPPPATTASLSANPTKISSGQSSTLTWSSANASSCTGGGFTASGISGTAVVYPIVTTAYSITCSGDGGSATALATVTISSPRTCRGNAKKCQ
jgi:peptidase A4-like protein